MENKKLKRGLFVTISGGEGSGKTTVANGLVKRLHNDGYDAVFMDTRSYQVCKDIRKVIMDNHDLSPEVETHLFCAALQYNWDAAIKKYIDAGAIVVHDRWLDDTYVYQYMVQQSDIIPRLTANDPDLSFLLNINPMIGLKRIADNNRDTNRFDEKDIDFHTKINSGLVAHFAKKKNAFTINSEHHTAETIINIMYKEVIGKIDIMEANDENNSFDC